MKSPCRQKFMFEEPTISDYAGWLAWHLDKRDAAADREIIAIEQRHSAAGRYRSGATIDVVTKELCSALNDGCDSALGELARALRATSLDRQLLRRTTAECLNGYLLRLRSKKVIDKMRGIGAERIIDERLAKMESDLEFKMRQFDVGFFNPAEPERPTNMTNNIEIGVMTGGGVQQGNAASTQQVESATSVDVPSVRATLQAFETDIDNAQVPTNIKGEIKAELATIRAQLEKATPSSSILREAGASLRNIVEGAVGSAVSSAPALWKLLGLS